MAGLDFTTPTGAKVVIGYADFEDAMALKDAIVREAAAGGIDLDLGNLTALKGGSVTDVDIKLKNVLAAVASIDSSPAVRAALWKCLTQATYNGHKIEVKTFSAPKAREDFYEIQMRCIEVNIAPFIKGMISRLGGMGNLIQKLNIPA